ncbi:MAG: 30S ribosomal protein S4 [Candidatus Micrarchaeota archaeon]|nr:30S ribosomal protein S4 [Candidatus Micrarchaeota archaeon]
MGDPRRIRNKYETPRRLWDSERIRKEKKLASTYGLKNMREVWLALQQLKKARRNAIRNIALGQMGVEKGKPLLVRLAKLGILPADADLEDVLSLTVENFLDRRLQTRVVKKGLARTMRQARQLITHGFIAVRGRKVTVPSYMVDAEEDQYISYYKPIDVSISEPAQKKNSQKSDSQQAAS